MAETVTIACKAPHGLILRLHDMVDFDEPVASGGYRTVKRAQVREERMIIKGYLEKYNTALPPAARGSSYAYTENVPKDFWEAWVKQNKDHAMLQNNLLFAVPKAGDTGKARELADTKSGLEPIDPSRIKGRVQTYKPDEAG